ncbi:MAG TPA: DUF433 domain-containing protein [Pirellulaceae bacterium]|nr:DUF433 domain-containing protein [Pirellulaceae bacterium]
MRGATTGVLDMQLEDYFEFISGEEIRLCGSRVGIEAVLSEYLGGALPEEIALNYPPVTLEQVHASITYYLSHRKAMDEYLDRWTDRGEQALRQQRTGGSSVIDRLTQARHSRTPP